MYLSASILSVSDIVTCSIFVFPWRLFTHKLRRCHLPAFIHFRYVSLNNSILGMILDLNASRFVFPSAGLPADIVLVVLVPICFITGIYLCVPRHTILSVIRGSLRKTLVTPLILPNECISPIVRVIASSVVFVCRLWGQYCLVLNALMMLFAAPLLSVLVFTCNDLLAFPMSLSLSQDPTLHKILFACFETILFCLQSPLTASVFSSYHPPSVLAFLFFPQSLAL